MRKRINAGAICSSDNYRASKLAHKAMLERNHQAFTAMVVSGEIKIADVPLSDKERVHPRAIKVKIFGREKVFSWDEYQSHILGFQGMKIESIW